ncbi:hypothetical protein [uncultured Chryseobacterium sp.]|uniref:hypothetical protein n=1 Tax=uncultured Chryseobacterium sp. TaxID=259322 RepID=UPI0025FD0A24|nr:hypothetical protein [uncultured Chryseobacterium sp.]
MKKKLFTVASSAFYAVAHSQACMSDNGTVSSLDVNSGKANHNAAYGFSLQICHTAIPVMDTLTDDEF